MVPNDVPSEPRAVVRPAGDLLEGTPYRLLSPLGKGGMGEVFEAEHRVLGHRVVIKVLRDALAARPDMRDRMRVEGQALARIRHPNLVMVTDFGETRTGHQFLVMERLVGESLAQEIAAVGMIPLERAVEIARQMLLGLSAAHEAGLVHRDVKPDNVFLCATEDGRPFVKMLDFGVVKIAQAGRDPRTPLPLVVPTAEGISLGTPRYFSPEQARRENDLDARCDVYAVGVVLHEMLAGRHPFSHVSQVEEMCRAHALEAPPLPSASGAQWIPPELDQIVMRALAKPREERFPTALAFAEELERLLVELGARAEVIAIPRPVFAGVPDAKSFAEAPTSPAVEMGSNKAPLTPSRKLSDAPVIIDNLVERALAMRQDRPVSPGSGAIDDTAPVHVITPAAPREKASIDDTAPMRDPVSPAPPPVPAARASVPETAPMLDLASMLRAPAAPAIPSAPPRPGWMVPVAIGLALLALAAIGLALALFFG